MPRTSPSPSRFAALGSALLRWPGILARSAFFYLVMVLLTGVWGYLFSIPPAFVEWVLRRKNALLSHTIIHHGMVFWSLPWRLIADIRLDAAARVAEGQAVVICNHHSYLDVILLLHIFPRIHMTARRSLFRIPFLGWAMHLLRHIPHREERPDEALEIAAGWLRRGVFVGVFPEGTRSPSGQIGPFKSGAFRLAQATTELIQPVVVVGSGKVWGKGQLWIHRFGPVAMRALPPVAVPAGAGRRELKRIMDHTRQLMREAYDTLELELDADPRSAGRRLRNLPPDRPSG